MNSYNKIEQKVAHIFSKFPKVKSSIKKPYQKLNYIRYKKNYNYRSDYPIKKISLSSKESFFGYYDKSPLNSTNEYVIFHSANMDTKNTPDPEIPLDIILYDVGNDNYEIVGSTYTYNWQQGAKLMWIDHYKFIYNDFDRERKKYISKIYDLKSKKTRIIDYPIYDCFGEKYAMSLNFERLNITRADYSYRNLGLSINWNDNSNDGLFYIDLKNNTSKVILSIEDIIKFNPKKSMQDAKHKFNHIMISPDGTKIMFIHRWFLNNGRRFDSLYVCNVDGSNIKLIANDDMVSHCFWYDNSRIFGYLRDKITGDKYYMININSGGKEEVGIGKIDLYGDGHPHIHNNKIVFDTYPDKARMKNLFLYDYGNDELKKLGEFFESFAFYNETRCDLHPRFSFDGKNVFFDSVHEGKRALYQINMEK